MKMVKLLDLFCGAGGAAMGYQRAGFEVTGVDMKPQHHYPFQFIQGDALAYLTEHGGEYDVIHASPPCQFISECTPMIARSKHPNLISATQKALRGLGKPYVIENVENARRMLLTPTLLCGSMFNLAIWRHRYFELFPVFIMSRGSCMHIGHPVTVRAGSNARIAQGNHRILAQKLAMGIDWMTGSELTEAIPPAYTEYIGRCLMQYLSQSASPVAGAKQHQITGSSRK